MREEKIVKYLLFAIGRDLDSNGTYTITNQDLYNILNEAITEMLKAKKHEKETE